MAGNGDLLSIRNRGRPSKEKKEVLECPSKIRKELNEMKNQLKYNSGTEILLAISIASDDMVRHVQMFPEVVYMDVTSKTNRQNRDLFLMVVKDASGETFVGNVTLIPSQQRWVFHMIYRDFFTALYGKVTVSRFRLLLTDDDIAEHGPLDCLISTNGCYKNGRHMLCIFHGIVMGFMEKIYVHLPTKSGRKKAGRKELSKKGLLYGMSCNHVLPTEKYLSKCQTLHPIQVRSFSDGSGQHVLIVKQRRNMNTTLLLLSILCKRKQLIKVLEKNVYKQPCHSFNCYSQRRTNSLVI